MIPLPTLGWSVAKNRYGDETGRWHLLLDKQGFAVPACGSPARTSGQVERQPGYGRKCQRCEAHEAALRRARAGGRDR